MKISKISPYMFRLQQACTKKNENLLGLPIWPSKNPNLFRQANQASKNAKFVQIDLPNGHFLLPRWQNVST
jgi:hypothetical protein